MLKLKTIFFLFYLGVFSIGVTKAQTNLVPNPSFEIYANCPSVNANMPDCANWNSFGNSPEYFHGCAGTVGMGVPTCGGFGYQYPRTGIALAGLITWLNPAGSSGPNYREFIGAQLTSTLQIGIKYFMSFFVNWSAYPQSSPQSKVASNKIGLRFSTVPSASMSVAPINNFAHLYTSIIYKDTVNWLKISGSFIADSAYKYVVIGNFFNDANTDTSSLPGGLLLGNVGAYYFIEDVCVSTDSLYNLNWTGINSPDTQKNISIKIFPNPSSDVLYIEAHDEIEEVSLLDNSAKIIYEANAIKNKNFQILLETFPKGIYMIRVQTKNGSTYLKLNIN